MKLLKYILLFLLPTAASSQDFLGYSNSNYAGIIGVHLNPANLADNRMKTDVALFGMNFAFANNYIGISQDVFKKEPGYVSPRNPNTFFIKNRPAFDDDKFQEKYLKERINSDKKSVYLAINFTLPSFMITLDKKSAIGFSWRERNYLNLDGFEPNLARQIYTGIEDSIQFPDRLTNKNLSIQYMSWVEYGGTYARVLKDDGANFIKAGATLKLLQGLGAMYMFFDNLDYRFSDTDTLSLFNTEVDYGHSTNFEFDQNNLKYKYISNMSVGGDLGIVYEYRPERGKYKYDMDGETGLDMRYKNKYKLKAGLAIVDIGAIKFKKGTYSNNFRADADNWDISNLDLDGSYTDTTALGADTTIYTGVLPIQSLNDTLRSRFGMNDEESYFSMNLPTTINASVDYNIWKDFYANITYSYAFKFSKNKNKVHDISTISLTPRWDWKWFGVFVPVSYNSFRNVQLGLSARLGPLIVGTNNLAPLLGNQDVFSADFHFLLKVPIMYRRTKDKDKDKVSDKKDKCKNVPGTWAFLGCPDRDKDHIPDNLDDCPDNPGLPKFNGCPDRDGDEIIDKKDSCPDVAGILELNGCPDKDGDKITDKKDSCPDEAGLAEFNGCPDRDHDKVIDKNDLCPDDSGSVKLFGCPDRDGDEIVDKDDRCPDKAGLKENDGCPLARLHLIDKQENIITTATIDKEGNFHFTQLPADENVILQLESYDVLIVNEVSVSTGKTFRVARRGTDGFFYFEILTVENKIPDTQIQLKKEEAEKVMKAMASLEFDFGKDVIRTSSMDGLDSLAELLDQNSTWRLKLSGHTDNVASMQYNMKLSEKRVEAIKKYLVKKGIAQDRIVLKWYGPTKPIAPNDTEEGKQKNRRVEFLIIK